MPHLIDVLIPVYNGARWLQSSIASIQAQTHRELRIHVVDDGSTDATPTLLAAMAAGDERIHVHTQANTGIVGALDHGLQMCDAHWLARHDADDLAHPERLARQLAYLKEHPDCVAVGATARHIDAAGQVLGTITELRDPGAADPDWLPAREPYLMHPFMLARRAAIDAAGGYRPVFNAEDSDLYWRLQALGRLHNLPDVLGDYRLHPDSLSSRSVRHGRLMAVGSQLAALSARRRRDDRPDLEIAATAEVLTVRALAEMVAVAGAWIDEDERQSFGLGVAAKLLELANYQPYELETADCRFVRAAVAAGRTLRLRPGNRRALASQVVRTAVRLHVAGRQRDARSLLTPSLVLPFVIRLAWQASLSPVNRQRLRAWARRLNRGPS